MFRKPIIALVLCIVLVLFAYSMVAAQGQSGLTIPQQATTPVPNLPLSGDQTGTCPMMSGDGSMSGMNMTGMSGMNMSGTGGMSGMQGTNMNGMPGMGASGMSNSPMYLSAPWYTNPWLMLGWVVLLVVVSAIAVGLILGIRWLVRRPKTVS